MEVNPRFGGGVICSIEAGAYMPAWILHEYLNIPVNQYENIRFGLLMMRANREFFTYADNY